MFCNSSLGCGPFHHRNSTVKTSCRKGRDEEGQFDWMVHISLPIADYITNEPYCQLHFRC
jgi:hypothetical protein